MLNAAFNVVYFDVEKAFNCFYHLRLLQKLDELGISGMPNCCIQSFLTKRTLRVKVGEGHSKCIGVPTGVPQGPVLRPVLFLLYINDCLNGFTCDAVMVVDDVNFS